MLAPACGGGRVSPLKTTLIALLALGLCLPLVGADKEAVKWFRKAALQGEATAQANLGGIYANGKGVPQDYVTSYAWYNIASANGDTEAATWKDNTAKQLTLAQITQAQALSRTLSSQIRTP